MDAVLWSLRVVYDFVWNSLSSFAGFWADRVFLLSSSLIFLATLLVTLRMSFNHRWAQNGVEELVSALLFGRTSAEGSAMVSAAQHCFTV